MLAPCKPTSNGSAIVRALTRPWVKMARTLAEFVGDGSTDVESAVLRELETEELLAALSVLDARSRQIVALRYGLGGSPEKTLEQIGSELGLTRERIRQLQKSAEAKLRSTLDIEAGRLEPFAPSTATSGDLDSVSNADLKIAAAEHPRFTELALGLVDAYCEMGMDWMAEYTFEGHRCLGKWR